MKTTIWDIKTKNSMKTAMWDIKTDDNVERRKGWKRKHTYRIEYEKDREIHEIKRNQNNDFRPDMICMLLVYKLYT